MCFDPASCVPAAVPRRRSSAMTTSQPLLPQRILRGKSVRAGSPPSMLPASRSPRAGPARLRGKRSDLNLILSLCPCVRSVRMSENALSPLASVMIFWTTVTRTENVRPRNCLGCSPADSHPSAIHLGGILGHTERSGLCGPAGVPKYPARRSPRDQPRHAADDGPCVPQRGSHRGVESGSRQATVPRDSS